MSKYLIDFENSHWCGGQLYVVVNASSPEAAKCIADDWMEETQRELFADEYDDQESDEGCDYADEQAYSINSVEELTPAHECWKWYKDPSQSSFYPEL